MSRNIVKVFAFLLTVLLVAPAVSADDAVLSKKDRKKAEKIFKGKQKRVNLPGPIYNDETAMAFCFDVGRCSDEEYNSLMKACEQRVKENTMLLNYEAKMTDRERDKYDDIYSIVKSAVDENDRYGILRTYCDEEREIIAEAEARKMPKGKIVRVAYSETGSSRPTPVVMHMALGTDSRMHLILTNDQFRDEKPVTVSEEVLDRLQKTYEENKLYKLHSFYRKPYIFNSIIEPLGGPPSCFLTVEFDNGTVIGSRTDRANFDDGCREFVTILTGLYWEKRKNEDNQIIRIK
ncbi:MAG: hypothetical protein J6U03_03220 [Muribaculaceae bacterium]|nr:hypothetical protein [Muribaculaceae bacterium]